MRLLLINEQNGIQAYPGDVYDQIRFFQDNPKDRLGKKLRSYGNMTNYVFGRLELIDILFLYSYKSIFRCGFLIFTQSDPQSDLNDEKNYQELLRVLTTAVKNRNKRGCQGLCS